MSPMPFLSLNGLRLFGGRQTNAVESESVQIAVETLGREHSGKTGARAMHQTITQNGPLPSGLELSASDPRTTARWLKENIEVFRGLQKGGFTSTIDPSQMQYDLFEADQTRAGYVHRESIGQLLTFTQDGDKKLQEHFAKHQEQMSRADVIHVFVPCPPDDKPENMRRLQNDLTILNANLRGVLNCRQSDRKIAVVLILTRPDGAYASADEAKSALTDERLRAMLNRLVRLVEGSERVGLGAILVTSAFGYGKARKLEQQATNSSTPPKGLSLLSEGEPEWILKEGEWPEPHNLTGLVWWSIMAGLLLKKAGRRGEEMARTAQMLLDDLKAMQAWYVPLNCRPLR
jgi:hypothetical protein